MKYTAYAWISVMLLIFGGAIMGTSGGDILMFVIGLSLAVIGCIMVGIAVGIWSRLAKRDNEYTAHIRAIIEAGRKDSSDADV